MTPTTFIVSQDCKSATAKAQMGKPVYDGKYHKGEYSVFLKDEKAYNDHIASLPTIVLSKELSEKVSAGQEIVDGVDFKMGEKGSYNDTDGVIFEPTNTAYPLTDAGEGKEYKLGDEVYYPCDAAPFAVVGIRKEEIEIQGDFSGGTHNVCQRSWVPLSEVKPFDYSKMKTYPRTSFPSVHELAQTLKEFDAYFDALSQPQKDAGNLWIAFTDKWNAFKKRIISPSASPVGVEEMAKEYAKKEYGDNIVLYDVVRTAFLAGHTAAHRGKGVEEINENDFLLWVVVNKWEYKTEGHRWINNYIGECAGMALKYPELRNLFLQTQNK